MSVIRFVEAPLSPTSFEGEGGRKGSTRTFRVQTSRPNESHATIRAHPSCPRIGGAFRSNTQSTFDLCTRVEITGTEAATVRIVTATYEAAVTGQDGHIGQVEALVAQPPDIDWDMISVVRTLTHDSNGNPYINSIGDPLDNQPPQYDTNLRLTIGRYEWNYNPTWAKIFANKTNSGPWLGFDKYEAKCLGILGHSQVKPGIMYWRVQYQFEFMELVPKPGEVLEPGAGVFPGAGGGPYGWESNLVINDGGRYKKDGKIIVVDDDLETAFNGLVRLGKDGQMLKKGEPSVWLRFDRLKAVPFGPLNVP